MKNLIIPFSIDFENNFNTANIDIFKWCNNNYKPDTKVYLAYNNEKISLRFISYEKERIAHATQDDDPVHCDNCVEFFMKPFSADERYLNFEFNCDGFMTIQIGTNRNDRITITKKYKSFLNTQIIDSVEYWGIKFEIPFELICMLYEKPNIFIKGYRFTGNFYKCADEFKFPHYGMWNNIDLITPDFHVSQFFGNITLE